MLADRGCPVVVGVAVVSACAAVAECAPGGGVGDTHVVAMYVLLIVTYTIPDCADVADVAPGPCIL